MKSKTLREDRTAAVRKYVAEATRRRRRILRAGFFFYFFSGKEAQHENRTLYGAEKCGMV